MTYAFTFDASACTGCKACQVACKDKNNLPVGVLWRRVFEVSGGSWKNVGAGSPRPGPHDNGTKAGEPGPYPIWQTDVFAYNLSLACNHCVHPKCAGVCPTDAFVQRADGIVYIDETKCMGCGYCAWACPYAVPQYNPELGRMTKCNFCYDNIDAGLPPACVAACPMRVLDFATVEEGPQIIDDGRQTMDNGQLSTVHGPEFQTLWDTLALNHPFPLPEFSRTQPHLAIKPHAGMGNGLEKNISNQEEVNPQRHSNLDELPLVIFTLCAQIAAGMAVFSLFGGPLTPLMLAVIGGLIGIGGLASFLHLGTPLNAWRAVNHLRKSWLSREILMLGLFGASWLFALFLPGMGKFPLALTGIGLVYSMAQVYRIKAVPVWNSWRTPAAFFFSVIAGGGLAVSVLDVLTGTGARAILPLHFAGLGLIAALGLALSDWQTTHQTARRLRVAATGLALAGLAAGFIFPAASGLLIPAVFLVTILEEVLGRWLFYASRDSKL